MAERNKNQTAAERARLKEALGAQLTDHMCASPNCPTPRTASSCKSSTRWSHRPPAAARSSTTRPAARSSRNSKASQKGRPSTERPFSCAAAPRSVRRAARAQRRTPRSVRGANGAESLRAACGVPRGGVAPRSEPVFQGDAASSAQRAGFQGPIELRAAGGVPRGGQPLGPRREPWRRAAAMARD